MKHNFKHLQKSLKYKHMCFYKKSHNFKHLQKSLKYNHMRFYKKKCLKHNFKHLQKSLKYKHMCFYKKVPEAQFQALAKGLEVQTQAFLDQIYIYSLASVKETEIFNVFIFYIFHFIVNIYCYILRTSVVYIYMYIYYLRRG